MQVPSPLTLTGLITLGLFLPLVISCSQAEDKAPPPYKDPSLPVGKRVNDLVSRMTLEEKVSQMLHEAPAIERLDVPEYNWWNEALHGVARAGIATVFPQAIGLAATWNTELMFRVATVISDEGRAKHHEAVRHGDRRIYRGLTFWSPNINIFRDPRWGRGMETYGEDPYLTARLGVAFVKGMQGDDPHYLKTVATPKHFAVHSGPEPERHHFDARVTEIDLCQTYLPAFRACVIEGGAYSVMGAYNRYMGEACCASTKLLKDILRGEWGFKGYVVSDCWAIANIYEDHKIVETAEEAAALAVKAGCDLNCGEKYAALVKAVKKGLITEEEIDVSVKRLFTARFKLGMFDPPEMVPYAQIPYAVNDCEAHRELALEAARESVVLLKNENDFLPLSRNIKSITVIGPNADVLDVLLGNYNGTPSKYVTVLEGIKQKVSAETQIFYLAGCELAESFVSIEDIPSSALAPPAGSAAQKGLLAELFDNPEFRGEPVMTAVHDQVVFSSNGWLTPPPGFGKKDPYSVRWTGKLIPSVSGRYTLAVHCGPQVRLYIDNKLLARKDNLSRETVSGELDLHAGRPYDIKIETLDNYDKTLISLRWAVPWSKDIDKAVEKSEAVIMCLGLSPRLEGEEMDVASPGFSGGDRLTLDLPGPQEELLKRTYAKGKPIALVLLNGSALSVNWADKHAAAIVEAWYPGEEGGRAVADVLFGDYNPAGRLPLTFYQSVEDLPPFEQYDMQGRTYRYFLGEPLYPFGHGLSYTRFAYKGLRIEPEKIKPGETVTVSVEVENSGERAGDEVVQVYLTDQEASLPVPIRALAGFERLRLEPRESRKVSFTLTPEKMSLVDEGGKRLIEPGNFLVAVGGKQPGFKGSADAWTTMTLAGTFVVEGSVTEIK